MTVKNGKIVKATEDELFEYYLNRGFDDIMPFTTYKESCVESGTQIIEKGGEAAALEYKGVFLFFCVDDLELAVVGKFRIRLSQCDQRLHVLIDTAADALLIFYGRIALAVIERQIEHILVRVGEAEVLVMVPLHRGA